MIQTSARPDGYETLRTRFEQQRVLPRIWAHDHTVWKNDPDDIVNRLGWLHAPFAACRELPRLKDFASTVHKAGFREVLLLGMGGSSLAPETYGLTFGAGPKGLRLTVLDSTHPAAVLDVERRLDLDRTLVVVATKSGTTTETLSLFRYIYRRMSGDGASPGDRFVAITDPGSPLLQQAAAAGFRTTFLNDPNLGGRYSALSLFGLVPAALLGIDLETLLDRARRAAIDATCPSDNGAVDLGLTLAAWAVKGRDKVTFVLPPAVGSFGAWVEQLIAESTGKERSGLVPVVGEPLGPPPAYGDDRLFVAFSLPDAAPDQDALQALERGGHPIVRIDLTDPYELAAEFFRWELATAIVGWALGINPFDQPNVESAKRLARASVDDFRRTGIRPSPESTPLSSDDLTTFLESSGSPAYVALQAYLPPDDRLTDAFTSLRRAIRDRYRVATTFGYGPRFLHSTGQLHKGDAGHGLFVQLVDDETVDLPIPDGFDTGSSSLDFGTLITAQAAGDRAALLDAGRKVVTFRPPRDAADGIARIAEKITAGGLRP